MTQRTPSLPTVAEPTPPYSDSTSFRNTVPEAPAAGSYPPPQGSPGEPSDDGYFDIGEVQNSLPAPEDGDRHGSYVPLATPPSPTSNHQAARDVSRNTVKSILTRAISLSSQRL